MIKSVKHLSDEARLQMYTFRAVLLTVAQQALAAASLWGSPQWCPPNVPLEK